VSPAGWGVVLDADVLLRSSARDLFLYLATLGTVEPVWSSQDRRAYLMLRRPPVGWADYIEHVRVDGLPKTAAWITTLQEPRR
jgi:hypothetical protein